MLAAVAAMGWTAIRTEEIPDEVKEGIARVKAVAIVDGELTAVEYGKGGLRVAFVLRPTPKSFIRCELGLADPSKWDGRFWGLGNGGWAGHVSCRRDGVAAYIHTDLGTSRTDRNVIVEDREVLTDYCWRATHLAAVEGKRLAAAYYGRKPDKCYFHGASCGGRQGIVEATRFPEDYDGIVSEVPRFTGDDLVRFVREPDLRLTADLSAFKRRGGKIIMYGGMEDLSCPEPEMRAYYDEVLKTMGGLDPVSDFFAYYAVPGRSRGAKGEPNGGLDQVGRPRDLAVKVVAWVERDERPGAIDFDWAHEKKRLTVTQYPENRVTITDRRGELSAKPLDVQGMIDAAPRGATVTVPAGDWEVKPFRLKSDLTLEVAKGATLWASTNLDDYAAAEGQRFFIGAVGATNVAIVGEGVFDGRGHAFTEKTMTDGASQPQRLPVMMRFIRCRNLRLEGFTYRQGGAWGCHLCNCDGVTVRRLTCFNHINHTNDGIDIESRNVLIEDCMIDADDDALVIKAETDKSFTVTNALIRNCTLRSCCNALKFGTGSYCDFRDVTVENCRFERARGNFCFGWYKYMNQYWPHIPGVTNYITGIAGMALEVVDGGSLENVTIRNISIEGYQTPIFIRLGRRHEPAAGRATYLRNVLIENVTGEVAESRVACSITGVPGLRPRDITLRNVNLRFPGGGTAEDAAATVPEKETNYPEAFMFDFQPLPAWAFYVRHADGIRFENVKCSLVALDARPRFVFDDADVKVEDEVAK